VEYRITWYYDNGTKIDDIEIEFEENGQIVSFGFYETEVPIDPIPQFIEIVVQWLIIGLFASIFLTAILITASRMNKHNRKEERRARAQGPFPPSTTKGKGPYF